MQGPGTIGPPTGLPLGGGRAKDAITPSDAAAMCIGIKRPHYLAARVRYGQDWSSCAELERWLWVEAAGIAHREKWVVCVGQETLRALAGLAVAEMADPVQYGSEPARVAWFGRRLDIEGPQIWRLWEKRWRGRFQIVYSVLDRWTEIAASSVWHNQDEG